MYEEATMFIGIGWMLMGVAIIIIVCRFFIPPKSKIYREYLVNMLVAGKVRQVADKEAVDLKTEDMFFNTYCKKSGIDRMSKIDDTIESELAEKLDKYIKEN